MLYYPKITNATRRKASKATSGIDFESIFCRCQTSGVHIHYQIGYWENVQII